MVVTVARVRVVWQEVTTYDQVFEIEGYDPADEDSTAVEDAICDQANFLHVDSVDDRTVVSATVIPE